MIELAAAAALLAAGVIFYRARDPQERYGSQGAILLLVIGAIVAIHAIGLLNYRPSAAETQMLADRARGSER
jgi:hypothetical protein